jgi:hypothetical protein
MSGVNSCEKAFGSDFSTLFIHSLLRQFLSHFGEGIDIDNAFGNASRSAIFKIFHLVRNLPGTKQPVYLSTSFSPGYGISVLTSSAL